MKMNARVIAIAAVVLLVGCSAYPRTEADFGNSVRQMVRAQTADPTPADASAPESGDGARSNAVVEAYRGDVSRGDQAQEPVSVTFGAGVPAGQ